MSVEELITKLSAYPPHYTVQALVVHVELDDETADFVDVTSDGQTKIVNLELDGRPM
jgi:hypothetical protein